MQLEILFQDDHLVAIDKPTGLLVHPTKLSSDRTCAMMLLRDQIQKKIFTVHRLDRATSGVLLFALDEKTQKDLSRQFEEHTVKKNYLAVVRGWTPPELTIDKPIDGKESVTLLKTLRQEEYAVANDRYQTSRVSVVSLQPITGRMHQLRRHLKSIHHPIIGDTNYGAMLYNKIFREHFNIQRLLLHCERLEIADFVFTTPWDFVLPSLNEPGPHP